MDPAELETSSSSSSHNNVAGASQSSNIDERVSSFLKENIATLLELLKVDDKRFQALDPPERRVTIDFIPFNNIACWRPIITNMGNAHRTAIAECMALLNTIEDKKVSLTSTNFLYDLRSFSLQLYNIGFKSESLKICRFEKDVLEARSKELPKIFNAHYAAALHRFSGRLWDQQCSKEALEAAERAIEIFRSLAGDLATVHNSGLASSLQVAATCLDDLGNFMDAIPMFEESIKIHRELISHTSQKIYRYPTLAVALLGLSNALHKSQCYLKAFDYANEALNLLQNKDTDSRPIFDDSPFIARAHAYVAQAQISLDDKSGHENALKCAKEAVSLARGLAKDRPQIFNHDLATYICILAQCELEVKQKTSPGNFDTWLLVLEAVTLHRQMMVAHPGKYEMFLARSLAIEAETFCDLKLYGNAIMLLREAEGINSQIDSKFPDLLHLGSANFLGKLSKCLNLKGDNTDALPYSQKALEIHRLAFERHPESYYKVYQEHLKLHARICTSLLQYEDALECIKDAIANRRSINGSAYDTELASLLLKKVYLLKDLKRWNSVLETGKEAIETMTPLTTRYPTYYPKKIANISHWCGYAAYMTGKYQNAITSLEKAIEIWKSSSGDDVEGSKELANAYSLLGEALTHIIDIGITRYEKAADAFLQALQIRRNLLQNHSDQKQSLVKDLVLLSSAYYESGRWPSSAEENRRWVLLGKALEYAMEAWSFAKENSEWVDNDTAKSAKEQEKKCFAKIRSMSGHGIQKLNREHVDRMDVDG